MKELWQVDVGYFCAGIVTENEKVTFAAPILNWAIGKPLSTVQKWVSSKNGRLVKGVLREMDEAATLEK